MEEKKIWNKIGFMSFVCCILVIWNHSGNAPEFFPENPMGNWLFIYQDMYLARIWRIDVPFFLMISGYLFYRSMSASFSLKELSESIKSKWNHRIKTLIIPYLIWNTMYYLLRVIASKITFMDKIYDFPYIPTDFTTIINAVFRFAYNPVFWFMYQLILLIIITPVIFYMLKDIRVGAVYMVVLMILIWYNIRIFDINTDALFYFSFGAAFALHGRKIAEAEWKQINIIIGFFMIEAGVFLCDSFYQTGQALYMVLYSTLVPAALWIMVDGMKLPEVKSFMKNTFFIYAVHFPIVRLISKVMGYMFRGDVLAGMAVFFVMPAAVLVICTIAVAIMRRIMPNISKVLTGGR